MFLNYIKVAIRSLAKSKGYATINILGLTIGIAACSLIMMYVMDELEFDRFHKKSDRTLRVLQTEDSETGRRVFAHSAPPVGPALVENYAEIEESTRLLRWGRLTVKNEDKKFYEEFLLAEQSFFTVFDFEFVYGDPKAALASPNAVVITRSMSTKYFGTGNPMGRVIETDRDVSFTVTGVVKDPPLNSHLQFDFLFSMETIRTIDRVRQHMEKWDVDGFVTYVVVRSPNDVEGLMQKIPGLVDQHFPEGARFGLTLQPLNEIHFGSDFVEDDRNFRKGNIVYLYIFSVIAVLIVLIGCINYMNLATARAARRAREVGLRKVVGATRGHLIRQFLGESMVIAVFATVLALSIVQIVLPVFNDLSEKQLTLDYVHVVPGVLLIGLVAGVVSGLYPALFLSGFRPASLLRDFQSGKGRGSVLRKSLVVMQFAISVILIVASLVVADQLKFLQTKELGFDRSHLVVVDINSGEARSKFETMKTEFARVPGVKRVSASSRIPGDWKDISEIEAKVVGSGDSNPTAIHFLGVDKDFIETYRMTLLEGKNFSGNPGLDTGSVILNQTAVNVFNLDQPIGREIEFSESGFTATVVGVVRDFHFKSLHQPVGPMILANWYNPIQAIDYFTLRIESKELHATVEGLQSVHSSVDPVTPIETNFLDQRLNDFYKFDQKVGKLVSLGAILAVIVACLGLLGLSAFVVERRTKEIGIRKVLGAQTPGIVVLLTGDFLKLVVIANVLAWPAAFFAVDAWLQNFAYRTAVSPGPFLLAATIAVGVAVATISYQAIRVSLSNPVDALRYE